MKSNHKFVRITYTRPKSYWFMGAEIDKLIAGRDALVAVLKRNKPEDFEDVSIEEFNEWREKILYEPLKELQHLLDTSEVEIW